MFCVSLVAVVAAARRLNWIASASLHQAKPNREQNMGSKEKNRWKYSGKTEQDDDVKEEKK